MTENGGRHKTLYLCREEEVCTLSVAGGDEGGINATFAPVHRGEKKDLQLRV